MIERGSFRLSGEIRIQLVKDLGNLTDTELDELIFYLGIDRKIDQGSARSKSNAILNYMYRTQNRVSFPREELPKVREGSQPTPNPQDEPMSTYEEKFELGEIK